MLHLNLSLTGKACGLGLLVALATTACGGVTQFQDKSALEISGKGEPPKKEITRVEVKEDRIEIKEKIQFAYNDATILEVSNGLLKDIATVLNDHKEIKKVEVGGHASTEGSSAHNMELSGKRAASVVKWLVEQGSVDKDRLVSKGFGESQPLVAQEANDADREKNRRVEFLIIDPAPAKGGK